MAAGAQEPKPSGEREEERPADLVARWGREDSPPEVVVRDALRVGRLALAVAYLQQKRGAEATGGGCLDATTINMLIHAPPWALPQYCVTRPPCCHVQTTECSCYRVFSRATTSALDRLKRLPTHQSAGPTTLVGCVFADVREAGRRLAYDFFRAGNTETALLALRRLGENTDQALRELAMGSLQRDIRKRAAAELRVRHTHTSTVCDVSFGELQFLIGTLFFSAAHLLSRRS